MKMLSAGRKPSTLDKIRGHYLEGKKLSEKQELKRRQYESANTLRIQGYSVEQTVRILQEMGSVGCVAEAYRVVRASEELFGDITKANKDGLRHILTENLMRIAHKAESSGNLKEANRSLATIAEINNLGAAEGNPIDWSKLFIPIPIYTSDPKVLRDQETLDIPHEDLEQYDTE